MLRAADHQSTDSKHNSPTQSKQSIPEFTTSQAEDAKPPTQVSEPLAPPPKPAPSNVAQTPDYFSSAHSSNNNNSTNNNNSLEFNPFEQSFGAPSSETPGKNLLPPVAALESPAIPGANNTSGYNWHQGLRAGPLSPAMLEGPAGGGDYFGNISRGFPTPNESSLRTGLTPGGGGSMFPAPSPNSQALFNSLQSGGATPGTLDFHRTAMTAAARNKNQYPATSNPQELGQNGAMDAQHDATDAANGLFMLAKGGQANQFAQSNQQQQMQTRSQGGQRSSNASADQNQSQDDEETKPATRGKKGAKAQQSNGRRKSEATQKGGNKRQKANNGTVAVAVDPALDPSVEDFEDDSELDEEAQEEMKNGGKSNGKKMTDEEKRRNFLERNRVAALKCRQRKKQWLANLQAKVEMYSAENDSLNTQVATLHDEIRNLRNLLIQHKDCPVGHAQGIGQFLAGMQDPNAAFAHQQMNPYGMAMPNGGMQAGMQRAG